MKWIIYKHTLIIECEHTGWSYIGQTCKDPEKRWKNGNGYLAKGKSGKIPVFGLAIKKYGWDAFSHEIIESNILTQDEANKKEQYWIKYYHTYLGDHNCRDYNETIGGESSAGFKHSEQTRYYIKQRLKEVFPKGKPCPMKGKHHTIAAIEKIRQNNIDHPRIFWKGKTRSQETKDKIRQRLTGTKQSKETILKRKQVLEQSGVFKKHWRPVIQFSLDGQFIKEWQNMSEIKKQLGIQIGNICKVCRGIRPSAGGFKWKYKDTI